eukprot:6585823-Prymnesium_polylepis.1
MPQTQTGSSERKVDLGETCLFVVRATETWKPGNRLTRLEALAAALKAIAKRGTSDSTLYGGNCPDAARLTLRPLWAPSVPAAMK